LILDHASRNAGTRKEGEPGSQCGSKHAPLRVRTKPVFGHCSEGLNIWGFLQTLEHIKLQWLAIADPLGGYCFV